MFTLVAGVSRSTTLLPSRRTSIQATLRALVPAPVVTGGRVRPPWEWRRARIGCEWWTNKTTSSPVLYRSTPDHICPRSHSDLPPRVCLKWCRPRWRPFPNHSDPNKGWLSRYWTIPCHLSVWGFELKSEERLDTVWGGVEGD